MAEMEKKVRSIRADDEVYAKFKEVCGYPDKQPLLMILKAV